MAHGYSNIPQYDGYYAEWQQAAPSRAPLGQAPDQPVVVVPPPPQGQWYMSHAEQYEPRYNEVFPSHNIAAINGNGFLPPLNQTQYLQIEESRTTPSLQTYSNASIPQRPIGTDELSPEYRLLLLSLSEQYIAGARRLATSLVSEASGEGLAKYHKLIAHGLRCMEVVIKKQDMRTAPRVQAELHLRYSNLLYEETENIDELENILSKGISFCEQNRLLDIKYAMQHLLSRVMFKSNHRASLKFLDHAIEVATSLNHTVWIYALRILRVNLSMQVSTVQEMHVALNTIKVLCDISKSVGDSAVNMFANIQLAMLHLRLREIESIGEAQRALANANAQRSEALTSTCPQLDTLVNILDLTCSLDPYDNTAAVRKLQVMQNAFDNQLGTHNWDTHGIFYVPIEHTQSSVLTQETCGIFSQSSNGRNQLVFRWLGKDDAYACGFMLSAIATRYKNASSEHKMERFIKEGLKMTDAPLPNSGSLTTQSLSAASSASKWRCHLRANLLLQLTLAYADRSEWLPAQNTFTQFEQLIKSSDVPESIQLFSEYVSAVISHGVGDLTAALNKYRTQRLLLSPPSTNKRATSLSLQQELSILATVNSLLIIRQPSHPSHHLVEPLMDKLMYYLPTSAANQPPQSSTPPHPQLSAAHEFLLAALPSLQHSNINTTSSLTSTPPPQGPTSSPQQQSSPRILHTKAHLHRSLALAKSASNTQLVTFALSYMNAAFFTGAIGDQAINSARAVRQQAGMRADRLWMSVGCGMLADVLGRVGRSEEAEKAMQEGLKLSDGLPTEVKKALNV